MKHSITRFPIDHHGAEAARRAGSAEAGAKQRAHVLLNRADVIETIRERHEERRARVDGQGPM